MRGIRGLGSFFLRKFTKIFFEDGILEGGRNEKLGEREKD